MAKFQVQSPSGRSLVLEGDTAPTEQELDEIFSTVEAEGGSGEPQMGQFAYPEGDGANLGQRAAMGTAVGGEAGIQQQMTYLQRQNPDKPVTVDNTGNILVDGVPANKPGFELGDLAQYAPRLPQDIASAVVGTAASATPAGPIGGMAAAGGTEAVLDPLRTQGMSQLAGMPAPGAMDTLKSAGAEAAFGAMGEGAAQVVGQLMKPAARQAKAVFARTYSKALKSGDEKFATALANTVGVTPQESEEIIEQLSMGNQRVFSAGAASETGVRAKAQNFLFGTEGKSLERHLFELNKQNPADARNMAKLYLGMDDGMFDTIIEQGGRRIEDMYKRPEYMAKITENFVDNLGKVRKQLGEETRNAHIGFKKDIYNNKFLSSKTLDLTEQNTKLADSLWQKGVLIESKNLDHLTGKTIDGYVLNPNLDEKGSKAIYDETKNVLDRLFSREGSGKNAVYVPKKTIRLDEAVTDEATRSMRYNDALFAKDLKTVSPDLAQYLDGYREKIYSLADNNGHKGLRQTSKAFREFAEEADDVITSKAAGDNAAVERKIRSFRANRNQTQTQAFSKFAGKVDQNIVRDLDKLTVGRYIAETAEHIPNRSKLVHNLSTDMMKAFGSGEKRNEITVKLAQAAGNLGSGNADYNLTRIGRDFHLANKLENMKLDWFKSRVLGGSLGGTALLGAFGVPSAMAIPAVMGASFLATSKPAVKGALSRAASKRTASVGVGAATKRAASAGGKGVANETLERLGKLTARAAVQGKARSSSEEDAKKRYAKR
jgi:hypothetical protein